MLIGSRALAHWFPEFKCREDSDWDFIGEQSIQVPEGARVEIHKTTDLNNYKFLDFNAGGVCNTFGLALIKRSHLWRDYKWDKHITQFHKHISPYFDIAMLNEDFRELYLERVKLTKEMFPQGSPKLNKTNEDFFNDAVKKVYDHDWLHELYAYEDKPMYTKLKKPGKENLAWCEKDLWQGLTREQKRQCVAEECYVIATERFLIPKEYKYPAKLAYMNALKKVCTTLCSGWFREYSINNYPSILRMFDETKVEEVKKCLD